MDMSRTKALSTGDVASGTNTFTATALPAAMVSKEFPLISSAASNTAERNVLLCVVAKSDRRFSSLKSVASSDMSMMVKSTSLTTPPCNCKKRVLLVDAWVL
jgi:hypothetical protein